MAEQLTWPCPGAFHHGPKQQYDPTGCESCRKAVGPPARMTREEAEAWLST